MIEIIDKSDGYSIVRTREWAVDKAALQGVPELLVLNFVNRVLTGKIEPVVTDGGLRFGAENDKYALHFYLGRNK